MKVIKLEQNYRSTVRILRSANALIAGNPKLFDKKLWSEHGHGDPIRISPAADDEAEAESVVRRLVAHRFEHRGPLQRLRHSVSRQSSGEALRAGAARAERAVRDLGRPVVFRARRDQGPRRLPAPHRQRRRRSRFHPRGDHAEARRGRDDAWSDWARSAARATKVSSRRCSPTKRAPRSPHGSARSSMRSAR